jgi:protein ImuA
MSKHPMGSRDEATETVEELRERLGLFSFRPDAAVAGSAVREEGWAELGIRPGGIVEWLVASPGAGAVTCALRMMSQFASGHGAWAFVDSGGECYPPALPGWGIRPDRTLIIRPATLPEARWAIEQCLRCPGVSATWAWVGPHTSSRIHRRWQLAAERGGGVGLFFRPDSARREPAWADLRLLATPQPEGQGESRRMRIDVLYRRGGAGGTARVWEIDHAAGAVRLVSQVADPAIAERAAGA